MDRRRAYLDSSIILRRLLGQPGALRGLSRWLLLASELVEVEALRVLHRLHSTGDLSDDGLGLRIAELQALMTAVDRVPLTRIVLLRAGGPFPGPLKTLDAIHLATALEWSAYTGESLTFLTHDRQLATAARACGLAVRP